MLIHLISFEVERTREMAAGSLQALPVIRFLIEARTQLMSFRALACVCHHC